MTISKPIIPTLEASMTMMREALRLAAKTSRIYSIDDLEAALQRIQQHAFKAGADWERNNQ